MASGKYPGARQEVAKIYRFHPIANRGLGRAGSRSTSTLDDEVIENLKGVGHLT